MSLKFKGSEMYVEAHRETADGDYHYDIYIDGVHFYDGVIESDKLGPLHMPRILEHIGKTYPKGIVVPIYRCSLSIIN